MKTLVSIMLVVLTSLAATACDSGDDGFTMPTEGALVGGVWVSDDAGTTRAFEFAAGSAYTLLFFPSGSEPAVAQRGTYTIEEGHLVTAVVESTADPSLVGQRFANAILDFDATKLVLESNSSASGRRVFVKSASLSPADG